MRISVELLAAVSGLSAVIDSAEPTKTRDVRKSCRKCLFYLSKDIIADKCSPFKKKILKFTVHPGEGAIIFTSQEEEGCEESGL
jgi:hypothetical protein